MYCGCTACRVFIIITEWSCAPQQDFAKFTAALVPWRLRGGRLYHTHNGVLAQRMQCSAATGKNVRQRARARARAQTKAELQSTTPDLHTYQHSVLSGSCIIAAALLL